MVVVTDKFDIVNLKKIDIYNYWLLVNTVTHVSSVIKSKWSVE